MLISPRLSNVSGGAAKGRPGGANGALAGGEVAQMQICGYWRQIEWNREQSDVLRVDSFGEA
jgi:hypothetical protein